jgi:hypothetical protein
MNSKSWCIANDIIIYPVPVKFSEGKQKPLCRIEINYKGKKKLGDIEYKQDDKLAEKINELYQMYYDKLS